MVSIYGLFLIIAVAVGCAAAVVCGGAVSPGVGVQPHMKSISAAIISAAGRKMFLFMLFPPFYNVIAFAKAPYIIVTAAAIVKEKQM